MASPLLMEAVTFPFIGDRLFVSFVLFARFAGAQALAYPCARKRVLSPWPVNVFGQFNTHTHTSAEETFLFFRRRLKFPPNNP